MLTGRLAERDFARSARAEQPVLMARSRPILILAFFGALVLAGPALAQIGNIFRDEPPPLPPGNVPSYPQGQAPYYPPANVPDRSPNSYHREYNNYPPDQPLPPADIPPTNAQRADQPPAEPLPAPMSLPPQRRPGGGGIQSQPLAPPPGTAPANQVHTPPARPQPGQPGQQPAQVQPGQVQPGQPQPAVAPTPPGPPPTNEVVVEPPPQRIANPTAVFEGLDKITGRTTTFDVAINETVQFGALQVTPRVCYSRPPTETPQTDSFVEVDEVTLEGKIRRIFTGWMFAASPGLHAIEHPIYDVWLTDCKGGKNPAVADVSGDQADEPAKPAAKPNHAPVRHRPTRAQRNSPGALPPLR